MITENEKFKILLEKDPNPGIKNRIIRKDNLYYIPGWVFDDENKEFVTVKYKRINYIANKIGYSSQIIYDILILGLISIYDRPRRYIIQ